MGTRGHGTWTKLYRDVWTNRKILTLARGLSERASVPERWSVSVAVGQYHRLLSWALAEQDDGQVGHLSPRVFAQVIGWDDPAKSEGVFDSWIESGLLDVVALGDVRIHDFIDANREILRKRDAKRLEDGSRPPLGRPPAAGRTPPGPKSAGNIPEDGRNSDSPSGSVSVSGISPPQPPSPPTPVSAEGGDVVVVKMEESEERNRSGSEASDDRAGEADRSEAVRRLTDEWRTAAAKRRVLLPDDRAGLEAVLLETLLRAESLILDDPKLGRNDSDAVELAVQAIRGFFAAEDGFLVERGWGYRVFPFRRDVLLTKAARAQAKAVRKAIVKAEPDDPPAPPEVARGRLRELRALVARRGPGA